MPVRVEPRGSQYCVVSTETGKTEKCYDNKPDAEAYATALNMAHARKKGYIHSELPLDDEIKQELAEWDQE
jgi:dsDNA-binding SOS-regulon protein